MITSASEHTKVTEVLSPDKAGVFTGHCVVLFEYNSFLNASSHPRKFVYHYANGDFEALREALSAINLSSICGHSNIDEPVNMSFVISKTRLAPIKTLTIPRLELQAAVVAARLKTKILEEIDFEVHETHFWSDSKIVLHYLSNTQRRFNVYVSHRVAEIPSKSDVREWGHIPSTMNVADDCTRVKEIHELTPESGGSAVPNF